MAVIESAAGVSTEVQAYLKSLRVSEVPRGRAYRIAEITGTIAAALAANASVFAMRIDPGSADCAYITRVRLAFQAVVAFTTPITAGRRLALFRGSGAAASGGTAIAIPVAKNTLDAASEVAAAQGGDARISTTGALTVTGITFESVPLGMMTLSRVGAAGAFFDWICEPAGWHGPIVLQPGQLLAVRNPIAMDAAGTWQLGVEVDWYEAPNG